MSASTPGPALDAVVFDLDGVIRHWNDDELDRHAAQHGLPPRAVLDVAFSVELGHLAVTGQLPFRHWMDRIRSEVLAIHGGRAEPVLDLWESNIGSVDPAMVDLVRRVRSQVPVALLSNGTTRLRDDLALLDLDGEFDAIFNTAEIGIAKPDAGAFEHVLAELDVGAARTAFIDDLEANVDGAAAVGMQAELFTGADGVVAFLAGLGVDAT